jgi:hypothetical protein
MRANSYMRVHWRDWKSGSWNLSGSGRWWRRTLKKEAKMENFKRNVIFKTMEEFHRRLDFALKGKETACCIKIKTVWEELITYFPLTRHGPHRKRRVQQLLNFCMCIRCHGNVFTEPSPSIDKRIHIQTQRLMGGITKVCHWDGLSCHDTHTKIHKDWFRYSKVDVGDTQTARWSHKHTFMFSKREK